MQSVGLFFKFSAKRQQRLERSIENYCAEDPGRNKQLMKMKLKPLCETRWVECHTSFDDLETLYEPLLDCLDNIVTNNDARWDPKTVTEANGLQGQLRNAKSIVPFTTCHYIFGFTKGLSRQLQGMALDIITAYDKVSLVKDEMMAIRDDSEHKFARLFASCSKMAKIGGLPLALPRIVGRQTLRANVEAENPEEYYRRCIFLPFIDHLIFQLNDRFCGRSNAAIKALLLIPTNLAKLDAEKEDTIGSCYEDDLPCRSNLKQELRLWRRYWSSDDAQLPTTPSETLTTLKAKCVEKLFPHIVTIFRIILTFSATSASVERTNSALSFVKNTYRSTMGEDRFNALVLLFVHRDIPLDYGEIINMYASRHPRRMLFANPLV
ncbi:52 kDa repressor of the inhibitor of the protein kinase-like [Lineus longissimus]|uniref:52 kDa repressor of the inhibitor of the protein kinase-like n=1 Tax=Lineus longissimus TaxID=88925 RepID=UPI00315D786A